MTSTGAFAAGAPGMREGRQRYTAFMDGMEAVKAAEDTDRLQMRASMGDQAAANPEPGTAAGARPGTTGTGTQAANASGTGWQPQPATGSEVQVGWPLQQSPSQADLESAPVPFWQAQVPPAVPTGGHFLSPGRNLKADIAAGSDRDVTGARHYPSPSVPGLGAAAATFRPEGTDLDLQVQVGTGNRATGRLRLGVPPGHGTVTGSSTSSSGSIGSPQAPAIPLYPQAQAPSQAAPSETARASASGVQDVAASGRAVGNHTTRSRVTVVPEPEPYRD